MSASSNMAEEYRGTGKKAPTASGWRQQAENRVNRAQQLPMNNLLDRKAGKRTRKQEHGRQKLNNEPCPPRSLCRDSSDEDSWDEDSSDEDGQYQKSEIYFTGNKKFYCSITRNSCLNGASQNACAAQTVLADEVRSRLNADSNRPSEELTIPLSSRLRRHIVLCSASGRLNTISDRPRKRRFNCDSESDSSDSESDGETHIHAGGKYGAVPPARAVRSSGPSSAGDAEKKNRPPADCGVSRKRQVEDLLVSGSVILYDVKRRSDVSELTLSTPMSEMCMGLWNRPATVSAKGDCEFGKSSLLTLIEPAAVDALSIPALLLSGREQQCWEIWRLSTFSFLRELQNSAIRLAQSGFYYDRELDDIRCFSCGLSKRHWSQSESPATKHLDLSPECAHANFRDQRNVSMSDKSYPFLPVWERSGTLGDTTTDGEHGALPAQSSERPGAQVDLADGGTRTSGGDDAGSLQSGVNGSAVHGSTSDARPRSSGDRLQAASAGAGTAANRSQATRNTLLTAQNTSQATQNTSLTAQNTSQVIQNTSPSTQNTSRSTQNTSRSTQNTSLTTQNSSHSIQNSSRSTQNSSRSTQNMPRSTQNTSRSTPDTSRSTQNTTVSPQGGRGPRYPVQAEQVSITTATGPCGSQAPGRRGNGAEENDAVPSALNMRQAASPFNAPVAVRMASFSRWPATGVPSPRQLVLAGFYFLGIGHRVRCFYCGVTVHDLRQTDDPWEVHVQFRFSCDYVRVIKGGNFVWETQVKLARASRALVAAGTTQTTPTAASAAASAPGVHSVPLATSPARPLAPSTAGPQSGRSSHAGLALGATPTASTHVTDSVTSRNTFGSSTQGASTSGCQNIARSSDSSGAAPNRGPTGRPSPASLSGDTARGRTGEQGEGKRTNQNARAVPLTGAERGKAGDTGGKPGGASANTVNQVSGGVSVVNHGGGGAKVIEANQIAPAVNQERAKTPSTNQNPVSFVSAPDAVTYSAVIVTPLSQPMAGQPPAVSNQHTASHRPDVTRPHGSRRQEGEDDRQDYLRELQNTNRELRQLQTCRLCGNNPINTIFLPCGHLCTCEPCAASITDCCLCHSRIMGTARVYFQ